MTTNWSRVTNTIYVSDEIHPAALLELADVGDVQLGYGPDAVAYDDIRHRVDAVLLRGEIFDRPKIAGSPQLRIIARHGVGTDNVDITAATHAGVWVTTTPESNSRAVAEYVFALALTLARQMPQALSGTAEGRWADVKATLGGFELHGRTLGLVGFGSIARRAAEIARGFGMRVLVSDPYVDDDVVAQAGGVPTSLDQLVRQADIVSLHVPLTDSTRHLIDADTLAAMRPTTVLINTSRGGLVDEGALMDALAHRRLGGAALDVLEGESVDMRDPFPHSVFGRTGGALPNLVVTPHIGGQTEESMKVAGTTAVACIRQALQGQTPDHAQNSVTPASATAV